MSIFNAHGFKCGGWYKINEKFKHILINNRCHDSVGDNSRAGEIELMQVAKAFGYKVFTSCNSKHDLEDRI